MMDKLNIGTVLVFLLLVIAAFFAVRAIQKGKTGGCGGDCPVNICTTRKMP